MMPEGAYILGIDPGKTGGLAILDAFGAVVSVHPMPMQAKEFDVEAIFQIIQALPQGSRVVMERVNAFPGQGVSSVWSFAYGVGMIHGLIRASQVPLDLVSPVTWQKVSSGPTGGDKSITAAWCARTFPGAPIVPKGCRKPHEGICDALGIAWFGVMRYGNQP
jgi:crossover junction endodeoxyribonuclease RuvC